MINNFGAYFAKCIFKFSRGVPPPGPPQRPPFGGFENFGMPPPHFGANIPMGPGQPWDQR